MADVRAVGSSVGWLIACGGAFKDAPIEGFEWLKFFRSPVIAGVWAALVSPFTNSYLLAALAGAGYSVATIETYKTFFFPNRPRGKFAGKPVHFPEYLQRASASSRSTRHLAVGGGHLRPCLCRDPVIVHIPAVAPGRLCRAWPSE